MFFRTVAIAPVVSCITVIATTITVLAGEVATVATPSLNVRSGPGTRYRITYVLRQKDKVEIIKRSGNWAFIVGARGGEGWVYAPYLFTNNVDNNLPSWQDIRGQIIGTVDDFARGYLRKNNFTFVKTVEQTSTQVIEEWRRSADGVNLHLVIEKTTPPSNVIEVRKIQPR